MTIISRYVQVHQPTVASLHMPAAPWPAGRPMRPILLLSMTAQWQTAGEGVKRELARPALPELCNLGLVALETNIRLMEHPLDGSSWWSETDGTRAEPI